MLKYLLISLILCVSHMAFSQTKITWETLNDVTFSDKYSKEVDAYFYYPDFGAYVLALEGKEVYLKGHMLMIDPEYGIHVLSKNPFASCFFCGSAGPESIVELRLKPGHPKFKNDQVVTMKGILRLNYADIYQCNYILEDAEVYK